MKISIVTTIYKSASAIEEFLEHSLKACDALGAEAEIIFVNDKSPDNGLQVARKFAEQRTGVVVINLARNVGQHRALWTGLGHATGDYIAMLDGDMEEDPLWLVDFYTAMNAGNADLVYGVQVAKKGSVFYRFGRALFYRGLKIMCSEDFPVNVVTARLMNRKYLDALLEYEEREIFLVGIMHMIGFNQQPMEVKKEKRAKSSYTLQSLLRVFITHTTSFSIKPLVMIFLARVDHLDSFLPRDRSTVWHLSVYGNCRSRLDIDAHGNFFFCWNFDPRERNHCNLCWNYFSGSEKTSDLDGQRRLWNVHKEFRIRQQRA